MKVNPYDQGYSDFFEGKTICVFREGSYYYKEWHRGFNDAYFHNLANHVQSIPADRLRQA